MSLHRKASGRDASGRILYLGSWWFKFKPPGQPLVTGYGFATQDEAAAAEAAARKAARAGKLDALRAILRPAVVPTVAQLAADWSAAGYAQADRSPRDPAAQTTQANFLGTALEWWGEKRSDHITAVTLGDYAEARRRTVRAGCTGNRMIDVELTVLSNLFQWAVATGRVAKNPFSGRPRFQRASEIDHAANHQPASDEELHQLCGWLMSGSLSASGGEGRGEVASCVVHGAQFLFQAFTGLRPGEPGFCRWDATYTAGRYQPGHRRTALYDGTEREILAVTRLKRGQNPTVIIHPALATFLDHWRRYCAIHWPASPWYFPNPNCPAKPLVLPGLGGHIQNDALQRAADHFKVGTRTAHAMRAYFVRVLRSQGTLDDTIAARLGQTGGARLIESVYGKADDAFGDGRFDFMPTETSDIRPAWETLTVSPTPNIIAL